MMGKSTNAKSVTSYLERLLEDEYLQEQLVEAVGGLRNVYGRAASKRAQAASDKKLYGSLRRAATSIRNALIALREPEPPPSRRGRNVLIVGLAIGAAAVMTKAAQRQSSAAPPAELSTSDRMRQGTLSPEPVATSP